MEILKNFPSNEEGYVVMDKFFHRIKMKSPGYLAMHRLIGNHLMTNKRILNAIKNLVDDDIVASFPEYKEKIDKIKNTLQAFIETVKKDIQRIFSVEYPTRKALAEEALKTTLPAIIFQIADGRLKEEDISAFVLNLTEKKLIDLLKL